MQWKLEEPKDLNTAEILGRGNPVVSAFNHFLLTVHSLKVYVISECRS